MSVNSLDEYWVPEHVKDYLRKLGFVLPLDDMEPWIRSWDDWMRARGDFYDYRDKDGMGRVYEVHRRSIHHAMRVCKEWGSLLLNEEVKVVCDEQKATDWIGEFFSSTNFMAQAQATVVRAFGLGTGAWASSRRMPAVSACPAFPSGPWACPSGVVGESSFPNNRANV